MNLRIKICGITQVDQGRAIAALGASALGFICVPQSPRYVSPEVIRAITAQLPLNNAQGSPLARIGVFANTNLDRISQTLELAPLTGVQLHGDESVEFCRELHRLFPSVEIIKALRVRTRETFDQARRYEAAVDTLLLDAYTSNSLGGTGQAWDWNMLKDFHLDCPWLLAGGLTPENVVQAIQQLNPAGIDLSSGVERSPGDKDLQKVQQLFENLRSLTHS